MHLSDFHTFRGYEILDREKKKLTPSMEDYMEMIYRLCMNSPYVRMNQLAEKLNVRTSSSTKIVQKLNALDLVHYEKYGLIELSEKGKILGEYLYHRHHVIERFLELIGNQGSVLKDTELIEHYIRPELLHHLECFNAFMNQNKDIKERYEAFIDKEMNQHSTPG